ncbi:uncharacterized protein PAC_18190 [Phialocephala subalpina]|uniref:DUF7708 domain-containing protein n=1 Tax=Phialocephala subalpina TaxID=576137 RepID=A0A1L7XTC3_9HELO|nr:uncharacterized protein PAC_18190 [Phialocephala subalpina]
MSIYTPTSTLKLRSIPSARNASENADSFDPAREAYIDAVKWLTDNLTADKCKRIWLEDKTDMQQVQEAVDRAKTVLNTLAQHNPEYCALAWGTMKFLLMAVINHEESITQISKLFSKIATALLRREMASLLFPIDQIKHNVSKVYACLLKFMLRAMKWYTEEKFRHYISAISRPSQLRFDDLLEEIENCSRLVDQLAAGAAQGEQRNGGFGYQTHTFEIDDSYTGMAYSGLPEQALPEEARAT